MIDESLPLAVLLYSDKFSPKVPFPPFSLCRRRRLAVVVSNADAGKEGVRNSASLGGGAFSPS